MLEEPFGRQLSLGGQSGPLAARRASPFGALFNNDPFFSRAFESNVPAIDLTEHANEFVVEAELPGVKKENVEIRIGDGGQSVTIEGKVFQRSDNWNSAPAQAVIEGATPAETPGQSQSSSEVAASANGEFFHPPAILNGPSDANVAGEATANTQNSVSTTEGPNSSATQLASERIFSSTSSFSRSFWLPRPVDGSNVKAKLEDGILTVRIPKAEDKQSVRVNID